MVQCPLLEVVVSVLVFAVLAVFFYYVGLRLWFGLDRLRSSNEIDPDTDYE